MSILNQFELIQLEETLWLVVGETGLTVYDFPFDQFFACRRPWERTETVTAIGRFGVTTSYAELYDQLLAEGIQLIHSPAQYLLASELVEWYPKICDLTPRSVVFTTLPTPQEVEHHFDWPVFVKGSRQTSRHRADLSIIRSPEQFERMLEAYRTNPVLHWQPLVCRELVKLRSVPGQTGEKIPPSFEFRTFWWKGKCVGAGPYWAAVSKYTWTKAEQREALRIAQLAVSKVEIPFVVVDVAQTVEGNWIVIECNDGQESGYAGVHPIALWQNIVALERQHQSDEPFLVD